MNSRVGTNLLAVVLIFSQLFAAVAGSAGLAWCQHADGQATVETAAERADCHAEQAQVPDGETATNCIDIPLGSDRPTQATRTDHARELASLHAAALMWALPCFGIDFHLLAARPTVRTVVDADDPSRDVVLDSLSTVILLT